MPPPDARTHTHAHAHAHTRPGLSASVLDAGGAHTCAIVSSDGVVCWGKNQFGQLGIGSTTQQTSPMRVEGASGGRWESWDWCRGRPFCVCACRVRVCTFSSAHVVRVCHVSECVGACVRTHIDKQSGPRQGKPNHQQYPPSCDFHGHAGFAQLLGCRLEHLSCASWVCFLEGGQEATMHAFVNMFVVFHAST
jgi:hypothetical protein